MRRLAGLALLAFLAACASGPPKRGERLLRPAANPAAVIAAEIAFNRLAQEKGTWAAFRATSTGDAVMFAPQPVNAQAWLKDRPEPSARLTWQPHQVWSSCDGSLALTKGAWQRSDGNVGYFTTLWRRQPDGGYKWVLDQGDTLGQSLQAPEMIAATVAECGAKTPDPGQVTAVVNEPVGATGKGASDDGTLTYAYEVRIGTRTLTVAIRRDGQMQEVLRSEVREPEVQGGNG